MVCTLDGTVIPESPSYSESFRNVPEYFKLQGLHSERQDDSEIAFLLHHSGILRNTWQWKPAFWTARLFWNHEHHESLYYFPKVYIVCGTLSTTTNSTFSVCSSWVCEGELVCDCRVVALSSLHRSDWECLIIALWFCRIGGASLDPCVHRFLGL